VPSPLVQAFPFLEAIAAAGLAPGEQGELF